MKRSIVALPMAALAALATSAAVGAGGLAAQEWKVAREQFAFAGNRLEITVDVDAGGTLRIIRGEPGNVRVAGRAVSGFTAAGLTYDERLTLSALGDGPFDYLVSVPRGVWVTVRLPDRHRVESLAGHARGQTYEWGRTAGPGDDPAAAPLAAPPLWVPPAGTEPFEAPLFTTYTKDYPPAEVSLPELRWVRSVTVRIEGFRFRVAASRPLIVRKGDPERLEIRPTEPPIDIVVVIPVGTPAFSLRTGDATALTVAGDDLTLRCSPVTRQWLSDGRRWVTFTPVDGALQCEPAAPPRRHG